MRKFLLPLLFVASSALGLPLDVTQTAESTLNTVTIDPTTTPLQWVDVTLEFNDTNLVAPGESFKVDLYQNGLLVGSDTFQNETTSNIKSCACIEIEGTISSNPFQIVVSAVSGSMELDVAKVVGYTALESEPFKQSEVINAALLPGGTTPGDLDYGIVYTRAVRAYLPAIVNDVAFPDQGYNDGAWDTKKISAGSEASGISPSDVVYDDLQGTEIVLNTLEGSVGRLCTNAVLPPNMTQACSAGEARVSPDGNQILYIVQDGYQNNVRSTNTPGELIKYSYDGALSGQSCIYHYNISTGVTTKWPCLSRTQDRQPTWISNTRVVFTSSRDNKYPAYPPSNWLINTQTQTIQTAASPYFEGQKSMKLWTADQFGNDMSVLTPHDDMAVRPFVLPNGDILYSCMQQQEELGYNASNKYNFPGTLGNTYWLCRINQDGGDATVLFGAHFTPNYATGGDHTISGKTTGMRAIRGIGYDSVNKWIYINNYYTATHLGLGATWRFKIPLDDPRVEGDADQNFNSSTTMIGTPWGQDGDVSSWYDKNYLKPMGINGYYVSATNGKALLTWGRGVCWNDPVSGRIGDPDYMNGEPSCDIGIYEVDPDTFPHQTPFGGNLVKIIDDPEWHEMDQDVVAPFSAKYPGYSAPVIQDNSDTIDPLSTECYLNVVNAKNSELTKQLAYSWDNTVYGFDANSAGRETCIHPEGCGTYAKEPSDIEYLAIYGVEESTAYNEDIRNTHGIKEYLMGEQPLQADGSVRARVPCETPFKMAGLDADGRQITKDQITHSLRTGEERFCWGCHDGHGEARAIELGVAGGNTADQAFVGTLADLATDPAELNNTTPVTWADVSQIMATTCRTCHSNSKNDPMYGLSTEYGWRNVAFDPQQEFVWPQSKKVFGRNYLDVGSLRFAFAYEGGSGYQFGDPLVFSSGTATGSVAAVDGSGSITKLTVSGGSYSRTTIPSVGVDSAGGSGAQIAVSTFAMRLDRPYTSRYVHKFPYQSLLYWKCVNQRMDGDTDATWPSDIDYGAVHASGATTEQCDTIGEWIETGARFN